MTDTNEVRVIDIDKALELLHKAVEMRGPGFNYRASIAMRDLDDSPACRYEYNGSADCMIGVALSLFDVPLDALRAIDTGMPDGHKHGSDCFDDCGAAEIDSEWTQAVLKEHGNVRLTPAAARAFRTAQIAQDNRATCGAAEALALGY